MQTRSSNKTKRPTTVDPRTAKRNNARWTVAEEREMIRLRRHEDLPFANIAHALDRSPESIKMRFEKLLMEHTEGTTDVEDSLRWFNLSH
jgi:hypothetical protein